MKVQAYSEIYRKQFKFLLAYADKTQHYVKFSDEGDILQMQFNRYLFLKRIKKLINCIGMITSLSKLTMHRCLEISKRCGKL